MTTDEKRPHLLGVSKIGLSDLDMKEAESMIELIDIMDFMDCRHIPYDGLGTIEEFKARIRLEYNRQRRDSPKQTIGQAICEAGENDSKKRDRLISMVKQLQEIVTLKDETKKQEMVAHFLETEGTTADLEEDCRERVNTLQGKECVILVAGESGAGKSSLMNLLFGEEILPVHAKSCTSTITTLRYGKHRQARIHYRYRDEPDVINLCEPEGQQEFNDIVFMEGNREEHDIKEVQVYQPIWFLKSGLVLADTPGIGENEFLEKYLMDYIEHNQILGFIYIIMSDHAGGVQEDRLLLLLKMIIEQQNKNKNGLKFDPKAALFVCNRWDAVPESERDIVQKDILAKLGKCWPEFDTSNVVFMSTRNAVRDIDAHQDYINDEFKALLDGIKKLFGIAMDRRIRASYKWMENVLKRIMHFLRSVVKRLDMSERKRQSRLQQSKFKLKKLLSHSGDVIASLRADLFDSIESVCVEVRKYLLRPDIQMRLTSIWRQEEIPQMNEIIAGEDITSAERWAWLKGKLDTAFYDRLCGILTEWDNDACRISEIEDKIVQDIQMKLGLLEHEIWMTENDLSSSTASNKSNSSTISNSARSSLSPRYNIETDRVKLPIELMVRMLPSKESKLMGRSKLKDFSKNPEKMAKYRAKKILDKLVSDKSKSGKSALRELVTHLFQWPRDILDKLSEKIPSIIAANENLLEDIEGLSVTERKYLANYEKMVEDIDALRKHLMDYGEGYIFVHDFKSDEVKLLHESSTGSMSNTFRKFQDIVDSASSCNSDPGSTACPRGLWTVLNHGTIVRDNEADAPVTIRVYLMSSAVENTFQEVAKLRMNFRNTFRVSTGWITNRLKVLLGRICTASNLCLLLQKEQNVKGGEGPSGKQAVGINNGTRCLIHSEVYLAEFLGIHHVDAGTPAFIYSGYLQSLTHYISKNQATPETFKRILVETATALQYLHSKGFVHMELTKDSLTVDECGTVCASGACLPRVAALPYDTNMPVADFVYLAPDVLKGGLYLATADIYGYGILFLELVLEKRMYKHEKSMTFMEFQEKVNPEKMLLSGFMSLSLTDQALEFTRQCLRGQVPSMDLVASMKEIKDFKRQSIGGAPPSKILSISARERQP